jgi:CrcB protein
MPVLVGRDMSRPPEFRVNPDVDLHVPADRAELPAHPAAVLGAIAAGGVLGALSRAGIQAAFPHPPTGFPWATFGINLAGCLLIGVLMAVIGARPTGPLVRPFLGVGVLGGFTTFSTYVVDIQRAVAAGAAGCGVPRQGDGVGLRRCGAADWLVWSLAQLR